MKEQFPFPCNFCGLCCKRVDHSEETFFLDRGDGTCRNFNEDTNLCNDYENRPLICRVEEYYNQNYERIITWDTFVDMNVKVCNRLQLEEKQKLK